MKIHQLSLFIENKPGKLVEPCRTLADAGVDILTLSLADTEKYGIMRLIVDDWQKATSALRVKGLLVNVTEVLAIEVEDKPGGLADLLGTIDAASISIEYMYAFTYGHQGRAVMIFRFEDADRALDALSKAGINSLAGVDLCRRTAG
jgi:hypothetical protein